MSRRRQRARGQRHLKYANSCQASIRVRWALKSRALGGEKGNGLLVTPRNDGRVLLLLLLLLLARACLRPAAGRGSLPLPSSDILMDRVLPLVAPQM